MVRYTPHSPHKAATVSTHSSLSVSTSTISTSTGTPPSSTTAGFDSAVDISKFITKANRDFVGFDLR
uniref:Uncharacterized protein n=1 Tax=Brassica campestris TaxID=3711 RepID=A0A3P6CU03_BRACM|nr:unnamed protein product [Brassica rapa]